MSNTIFFSAGILAGISLVWPKAIILALLLLLVPQIVQVYKGFMVKPEKTVEVAQKQTLPLPATRPLDIRTQREVHDKPKEPLAKKLEFTAEHSAATPSRPVEAEVGGRPEFWRDWGVPTLRMRDESGRVIPINSDTPVAFENEFFVGCILFMVRTEEFPEQNKYANHFNGKQRRFEMQIQGKFKKLPKSVLYMGGELYERIQFGYITRALISVLMAFCQRLISNMHFSFGEEVPDSEEEVEIPHITFPLFRTMDRVVETPPDEVPPLLGGELPETEENRQARRSGKASNLVFKMDFTYTFSFHSMYIDFAKWALVKIPGRGPIDLHTFIEQQSAKLVAYDLTSDGKESESGVVNPNMKHVKSRKIYLFQVELTHVSSMTEQEIDNEEKSVNQKRSNNNRLPSTVGGPTDGFPQGQISQDENDEDGTSVDEEHSDDDDEPTSAHLIQSRVVTPESITGSPINYGSVVPLMGMIPAESYFSTPQSGPLSSDSQTVDGRMLMNLADASGFAVLRRTGGVSSFLFTKIGDFASMSRSKHRSRSIVCDSTQGNLLYGDVVTIQDQTTMKYLTVYRGWWVGWSSTPPTSTKAQFILKPEDSLQNYTGHPCVLSNKFRLGSFKWSKFEVGVYAARSREYNGHLVGLFQFSKSRMDKARWKNGTQLHALFFIVNKSADDDENSEPSEIVERGHLMSFDTPQTSSTAMINPQSPASNVVLANSKRDASVINYGHMLKGLNISVPAWIELFNRSTQKIQQAYMLTTDCDYGSSLQKSFSCSSIRTARDLSPIIDHPMGLTSISVAKQEETLYGDAEATAKSTSRARTGSDSGSLPSPPHSPSKHRETETALRKITERPLQHQNQADRSVRALQSRLQELLDVTSLDEKNSLQSKSKEEIELEYPTRTAFCNLLQTPSIQDSWFLRGSSIELGVVIPASKIKSIMPPTAIARCMWDSHWREEAVVFFPTHVNFYQPMHRKPSFILPIQDVLQVRAIQQNLPFYGYFFLAIETLGKIHYICFADIAVRDSWLHELNHRIVPGDDIDSNGTDFVLSDPLEGFVLKSGQWKPIHRLVMNSRRMKFDMHKPSISPCEYIEYLCKLAFSQRTDAGKDPLQSFLDAASALKLIDVREMVNDSAESVCFFVNLYHTLLQHARLLLGPPTSSNWSEFFTSVSYEVGNDVFSLVELEYCVIRGRMSRPKNIPRGFPAIPSPNDDHYRYSLNDTDFRVNFVLNNGCITNPSTIHILRPRSLGHRLNRASEDFVQLTVKSEPKKKLISLPRICDMHMVDFGEGPIDCAKVCLRFLERSRWEELSIMLQAEKPPNFRFRSVKQQSHPILLLLDEEPSPRRQVVS